MSFIHHFTARSRARRIAGGNNSITFQTECGVGDTFDPTITLAAGCPHTPTWDLGNGDTASGAAVNYNSYADAGPHWVTLHLPDIDVWLTEIDVRSDKIVGDFLGAIAHCTALTSLTLGDNTNLASDIASLASLVNLETAALREHQTSLVGDISVFATLPNLTYIYCAGCGLEGDLADLAGMTQLTYLDLHAETDIVGELSDLSALTSLTYLALGNTSVTGTMADLAGLTALRNILLYSNVNFTGSISDLAPLTDLTFLQLNASGVTAGDISANTKMQYCYVHNLGWNQATVDAFLLAIYNARATYTFATPTLLIHGTNATPGGVYQDGDPPTTGLEYVFELENDPESEGFNTWAITYS